MTSVNKRRALLGSYCPSFFNIQVNSCKDIYASSLFNSSVLFHEYIHYMQDMTTTAGYERLWNLLMKVNYLCLELQGKSDVAVPYAIKSEAWKQNDKEEKAVDCHDDYRWTEYKIADIVEEEDKRVVLKIEAEDGLHDVPFGTYQVEEIMAECCESTHPLYTPSSEYPYTLWEKFNDFFHCKLTKQDFSKLSLVSLIHPCPGIVFYDILGGLKYFKLDEMLELTFKRNLKHKRMFRDFALASMKWLYGGDFPGVFKWFYNSMLFNDRYDDFETFIKLLDEPMLCPKSEFFNFFIHNGFPIVRDKHGNYGYGAEFEGEEDLYGLVALMSCMDMLFDKSSFGCPFQKMCDDYREEKKEQRLSIDCAGTPWNYQNGDKLCIFSKMWKSLGFPSEVKRAES